ncbi:Myelin-associated glycoprotein [Liparis tanakae]|uniref:Myelin-associated glycoprotein n=1 Tax=Liparis tanakae TaxID=230148 RepID=A0A4Z2J1J2_9TELE|nr:Myelin-associated glycoprotein [Liparis tanakae]
MLFLLSIFLTSGVVCQRWESFMPQSLEGLSGSCVTVPCTFTLYFSYDSYLDETCVAIWMRGWSGPVVFDSGLTPGQNILQGKLTGNLRDKDCTTVFDNLPSAHNERYYFRLQCDNDLKVSFVSSVIITTQGLCNVLLLTSEYNPQPFGTSLHFLVVFSSADNLPKPVIAPSWLEVEEGSPVRLTCSTVAPCAGLPPALTWTPTIGDIEESVGTTSVTSVLKFTASYRHDGLRFSCSALHNRQAGNSDLQYENSLTLGVLWEPELSHHSDRRTLRPVLEGSSVSLLCRSRANPTVTRYTWYKDNDEERKELGSSFVVNGVAPRHSGNYHCMATNELGDGVSAPTQLDVQFAPEILPESRCVKTSSRIRCFCDSQGNPPPSLIWKLAGEVVNHSSATPIQKVPLGSVGMRSVITLNRLDEATPSLVCVSFNSLGSHSFELNLFSSEPQRGLHALSLFLGSAVGAVGMLLACVPLLIFFCRKRKERLSPNKRLEDTSDILVSRVTNSSKLDVIYANKATLEEEEEEEEEDPLHYAAVDFAKLRAELGGGEIRGLASMTAEYAEIRLHSGGDAEEEEAVADTHLGKGKSTDGLIERVSEGGVA